MAFNCTSPSRLPALLSVALPLITCTARAPSMVAPAPLITLPPSTRRTPAAAPWMVLPAPVLLMLPAPPPTIAPAANGPAPVARMTLPVLVIEPPSDRATPKA
ncbi:hypothetical protein D9M72_286550 [compost metagenome]